jgi:bifunctional non-homologous end joining protein LigD
MSLQEYRHKRQFGRTPEPQPAAARGQGNSFVVQQHDATRMHWDLRLEIDGVLASWAVPKGPSLNPGDKRLAVRTEDHPLDYASFEGVIPEGEYGAGTVMVWDNGRYELEGEASAAAQMERGDLKFRLHGHKLRGSFALIHSGKRSANPKDYKNWLLIKHRDDATDPDWDISKQEWSAVTGRSLSEIAAGLPPRTGPAEIEGAKKAALPREAEPMLATLVDRPFSDPDWLFDLKWDGMRALTWVRDGRIEIRSRRGRTVTSHYPELAVLPQRLAVRDALVDGEIVALDEEGRSDFGLMQQRMHVERPSESLVAQAPVIYYLFDILYADGYDLRGAPLVERKRLLRRVLLPEDPVRYSDHVVAQGRELFELARERGLEGVIAKQARSRYTGARGGEWVKLKTTAEIDAVVGGFTAPRGGGGRFGALLLGLYDDGRLRFIGGCGSGFTRQSQEAAWRELEKRAAAQSPFAGKIETREKATWVKPELVARVRYSNWTHDQHLRAPVYLGLRDDVVAEERLFQPEPAAPPVQGIERQIREAKTETLSVNVEGQPVRLSHLNKVYFPEKNLTKRDLLCYYARVAPLILPFLRERPLVLRRMPEGLKGHLFYQKDAGEAAPDWMTTVVIPGGERGKDVRYYVANDMAALLYLTNLGCIDHNPWASRIDDLDHPDYLFVDLDPTDDTPYSTVVDVARACYGVLSEAGLKAYLKTSGATGFHIYVPLERVYDFEVVTRFTEVVTRLAADRVPGKATFERIVERRPHGRVLLDYAQISYSRPLTAVYSVRPAPHATVSAPVAPDELKRALKPERFTIETMPERLEKTGDLWRDFWQSRQRIEPALARLRDAAAKKRRAS